MTENSTKEKFIEIYKSKIKNPEIMAYSPLISCKYKGEKWKQ